VTQITNFLDANSSTPLTPSKSQSMHWQIISYAFSTLEEYMGDMTELLYGELMPASDTRQVKMASPTRNVNSSCNIKTLDSFQDN
jgi:hypothetical protein